ncbi:unnamed protein product [Effrenium voratum]|uniref:Amino acid transporter transmembrane domain-containing protein n=1 Tax=Effrenium voratum TaxID=2562239 RepID=A0AA36J2L6_9DINO|nr:unnamed protein product [Effrenium voratum]
MGTPTAAMTHLTHPIGCVASQRAGLGYLVGPAISAFEGVLVSQYVFVQMKLSDPAPFGRVVIVSHLLALLIFGFIGAFGFGIYGSRVEDVIYENFPPESLAVKFSKLTMSFVLVVSFQIQMFVVFSILDSAMQRYAEGASAVENQEDSDTANEQSDQDKVALLKGAAAPTPEPPCPQVMRWIVIVVCFYVAALLPSLSALRLGGGLAMAFCAMVVPGAGHLKVMWDEMGWLDMAADVALIVLGILSAVLTVFCFRTADFRPAFSILALPELGELSSGQAGSVWPKMPPAQLITASPLCVPFVDNALRLAADVKYVHKSAFLVVASGRDVSPRLRYLDLRCADRPIDLQPAFSPQQAVYGAQLDFAEPSFAVDAQPAEGADFVNMEDFSSTKLVAPGKQVISTLKVRNPESKEELDYSVTVQRLTGKETQLRDLRALGAQLEPAFAFDTEAKPEAFCSPKNPT